MAGYGLCSCCRIGTLFLSEPPDGEAIEPPAHCYGSADVLVPPGIYGGFTCSCECRDWKEKDDST